ncbi:MAG: WD40 repeat domain-containing protein [Planctomycetota bacterium]|jgi:WD40 repeat protein
MLREPKANDRRLAVLAVAALACCFSGGCWAYGKCEEITFSPDGQKVAYVWADRCGAVPVGMASLFVGESEYLLYASGGPAGRRRSILIDRGCGLIGRLPAWDEYACGLTFSPDSSQLAAAGRSKIIFINLASGKRRDLKLPDERIASLRWLSNREVAYSAVQVEIRKGIRTWTVSICRQYINEPYDKRRVLFSEKYGDFESPVFVWSPDLKHVLLVSAKIPGPVRILDPDTGDVSPPLGHGAGAYTEVAWKPDSSAVLYACQPERGAPDNAKLLDPKTRRAKDFTGKFRETFGEHMFQLLDWTPDGQYVLAQSHDSETYLLRLEPWKVIPFEQEHDEKLPKHPDFVRVIGPLGPEGWLYVEPNKGTAAAVDYQGRHVVPLHYPRA